MWLAQSKNVLLKEAEKGIKDGGMRVRERPPPKAAYNMKI